MSDVFSERKRSEVMSQIRGSGNKETELALINIFRESKITGWRRCQPIFGNPDFVFAKRHVAIFVDGCFWHRCPKHSKFPKSNRCFWRKKLLGNVARDKLVNKVLRRDGWRVLRIWEHEFSRKSKKRLLWRLRYALSKGVSQDE